MSESSKMATLNILMCVSFNFSAMYHLFPLPCDIICKFFYTYS